MFSKRFVVTVFQNHGSNVDFVQKRVKLSWRGKWKLEDGKASASLHLQKTFCKGKL